MVFEDEEPWPANPWQAQADAQLQRWVQETVTVQRLHQLEGQLEAAEAALAARSYELEQASKELELLRHRKAPVDAELVDLREKNDFLQVLIKRFERKVMVLEEENVKLKAQVLQKDVATQAEEPLVHELEGQLALLEGDLRSKEHELRTAQAALSQERGSLGRFRAAAKGRTPLELMKELEALQSQNGFLQDLVSRFEDKTMMMEKQLKSLGSSKQELHEELARCRREHLEAKAAASEELRTSQMRSQQLKEEAKGAALTLRDAKREHNKRVQEFLKQLCEAKGKAKKINEDLCDRKELRELKELNGQLVERLGKERADKAEAMGGLERCRREQDSLELRCKGLCEQLIQLAELNEELELRCT